MNAWQVERADPDDAERVRRVRLRALGDAPDAFGTSLAEDAARPPEAWRTRLLDATAATFLATGDGRDVGLVVGAPYRGLERSAGLFGLWVDPSHRGRGIGDRLVEEVVAWARAQGYARVVLDVGDANAPAVRLYERHGFAPTGAVGTLPPPRTHVREHQRARSL